MARGKQRKGSQPDRPGLTDPTSPLDGGELLTAARPVLVLLREDLGRRAEDVAVERALRARYASDKKTNRTADSFDEWRDGLLAQVAASWFLSCVFVRTLEDRGLLGQARLAGPGATDSQTLFFELAPSLTERDYLLFVFRELADRPAARALFDSDHALVWQLSPSADAAKELLRLFRTPSADTPAFRFGQSSTRFLGDLYQDLYEDVRKRYALLQTPDFIESFILDRTLEPAIERFGLDDTTLIDPTCGSGHFLLGAFDRLFDHRLRVQPGIDVGQAAHKSLDAVFGADINPYAVAIARVRLTLSFLEKAGVRRLKDAPALPLHLVVADSLLHNPQHVQQTFGHLDGQSSGSWEGEPFQLEDPVAARDVLHRRYAAVVGNPPYITEKDSAKRETYRSMYPRSAAGLFSLASPFCERFFQLARERGSVGQITANSFMKREFGKKLIEEYLPSVNLELIVNTSGAYIPGHGTPTVLLFGTNEPPVSRTVLSVLAKRGEPSTPTDPTKGQVWSSIATHWNDLGFENDYISVADSEREKLSSHPWSLGGGGAVELKELLEERTGKRLGDVARAIGFMCITKQDEVFAQPVGTFARHSVEPEFVGTFVMGEHVRDWSISSDVEVFFPYDQSGTLRMMPDRAGRLLWPYRAVLEARAVFGGQTFREAERTWFEYGQIPADRIAGACISFAFVATHNHFVLDRGKVFNRTAPIVKLHASASEDDHLALLAYLNSSTACFWMKQVFMNKGGSGVGRGIQDEAWEGRFEFDGTKLREVPLFVSDDVLTFGQALEKAAQARSSLGARQVLAAWESGAVAELHRLLTLAYDQDELLLSEMVALQESLDWTVYRLAGLASSPLQREASSIPVGMRAFEHRLAADEPDTQWFVRNGYIHPSATSEAPPGTVERLDAIADSSELGLVERPEYKRRWSCRDRQQETSRAASDWLLDRLEQVIQPVAAQTRSELTGRLLSSPGVLAVASLLDETHPVRLLARLAADAAVAFVAAARFTDSGLGKYALWCSAWESQRAQDAGELAVPVGVPPRYDRTDFEANAWQLRGKLDVPKERFISYPGCESDEDDEPVYGWAGWNHLQRAQALASLYQKRKTDEGWTAERLTPMLAGLLELLPWIKQWHNEPDAEFGGLKMGDYFAQFLDGECQSLGLTQADLESWRPTKKTAKKSSKKATKESTPSPDPDPAVAAPEASRPRRTRAKAKPTRDAT